MSTYVGKPVARVDAHDKVTGCAIYSTDVDLPGMLFGATFRSPVAHARITKIETSEAMKVSGVKAVVTGREFPFIFGTRIKDQPFLAIDRVRYIGEPIAAVAAALKTEDVRAAMDKRGEEPRPSATSKAFNEFMRKEAAKWADVIKAAGIKLK